jgi:hypothetical protein
MDFTESMAFINRSYEVRNKLDDGEPVILTENDKKTARAEIKESNDRNNFFGEKREFKKIDDVMLVHKTNFAPHNSTIETRLSANITEQSTIPIYDGWYTINERPCRNTIHFSANHEVSGNSGGNWDSCKYVVITPLVDIPKERVKSNSPVDTFAEGAVSLKEGAYVLCPKEEMDAIKEMNPGLIVVGYEGDNALYYANTLLWMLGYPVVYGDDWGMFSEQHDSYKEVLVNAGYDNFDAHKFSKTKKIEEANYYMSYAVGILELIMKTPELRSIEDLYELAQESKLFNAISFANIATPGYLNKLLAEIGMSESFTGQFANVDEFRDYCVSLIEEAKNLAACK